MYSCVFRCWFSWPHKPIESHIFSTRGKLLSSLHRRKRLKAKYPYACCWKWTFPRAMSKMPSFSRHCDTATGHGAFAPRSNCPRPRVIEVSWGFSLLTEPPSVEGNLTSDQRRVRLPYHGVWRKKVFWTWLEEMFISSNMRGYISLLNVFCGAAMIEVCLWTKKYAIRWVFGSQTAFE